MRLHWTVSIKTQLNKSNNFQLSKTLNYFHFKWIKRQNDWKKRIIEFNYEYFDIKKINQNQYNDQIDEIITDLFEKRDNYYNSSRLTAHACYLIPIFCVVFSGIIICFIGTFSFYFRCGRSLLLIGDLFQFRIVSNSLNLM